MAKWTSRLRQLIHRPIQQTPEKSPEALGVRRGNEGWQYLNKVRHKLSKLADDFAQGRLNRVQFEELYAHYQKERADIERIVAMRPDSGAWRTAVTEGQSVIIRHRLAARVLGYAVYANQDQAPLRVFGELAALDETEVASLLSRLQREASEPFVANVLGGTDDEDATCLCAVPGQFSTLIVLFTNEPARVQIQLLQDLHHHFEQANYPILSRALHKVNGLVFPYAVAFE